LAKKTHLFCECGGKARARAGVNIRCPECGALLQYVEADSADAEAPADEPPPSQRRGPREAITFDGDDDPADADAPPDSPTRSSTFQRARGGDRDEPAETSESTFAPRRSKRKRAESQAESESAAEPAEAFEGKGLRRKRKNSKRDAGDGAPSEWWRAWIDPALLLWMPVLVPGNGVLTFILALSVATLNPIGMLLGLGMATVPFGLVALQFSAILSQWAQGDRFDPEWPDLELWEMLKAVGRWIGALIFTMLAAAPFIWLIRLTVGDEYLGYFTIGLSFFMLWYFLFGVMAASMGDTVLYANPVVVLPAMIRTHLRFLAPMIEILIHLAVHLAILHWVGVNAAKTVFHAIGAWLCWWVWAVPSLCRIARVLGAFYFRNADRIGWFRTMSVDQLLAENEGRSRAGEG
jgi:hypothetical protein